MPATLAQSLYSTSFVAAGPRAIRPVRSRFCQGGRLHAHSMSSGSTSAIHCTSSAGFRLGRGLARPPAQGRAVGGLRLKLKAIFAAQLGDRRRRRAQHARRQAVPLDRVAQRWPNCSANASAVASAGPRTISRIIEANGG